ncbi:hypothetical protein KI655_05805 [Vibrio sp. D404a]|uniref:hypothetical protein n=1 Tax=unclassified Vibrio TaxID=2614977 RepID=UPI002553C968|nr:MULTISPECIES: hypothetical protein [unclassified Vibrio]MDK9736810.1 hypothetical protein [Vibrio sp. D404a]MDK9795772.1 hypothetical protein [Vibrio sp. D449a]
MKLKSMLLASLAVTALSGCLTVPIEELQPTADQKTIDTAIEHLSDVKGITITENGVIYYVESLPGNSRWATAHIMELSYRFSCEDLRWFVDRGMIVRMRFQGNSGTTQDYDLERCETEVPTDLYESKG